MENKIDFEQLAHETRILTGFTNAHETLLIEAAPDIKPHLVNVTEAFYTILHTLPKAQAFLDGRLETLKKAHLNWLESLFTGPFDANFAQGMYHVGMVHVRVKLPVEFMQGAGTLILSELISVAKEVYQDDAQRQADIIRAINGVIGFSVTIMQESYQASSLAEELDKFLAITGMSRTLFNNLALAYEN